MRNLLVGATTLALVAVNSAADAQDQTAVQQAIARQQAQTKACQAEFLRKEIKTYLALSKCTYGDLAADLQAAGYPYMDLVNVDIAERMAIAERIDRKKITLTEGQAEEAEVQSRVSAEERRRDQAQAEAERQAAAQADAEQRERAIEAQQRYQTQLVEQQAAAQAAQADADRRSAQLRFAAGMLAPTRTGSFAESLSNAANAYAGVVPQPTAPVQTLCQRLANGQVYCTTQ